MQREMKFVNKQDIRMTLGNDLDERYVCEFKLKNVTKKLASYNFTEPNYRLPNSGDEFNVFSFFCDGAPTQYQQVPPRNKSGYAIQNLSYKRDVLVLDEEKEIKKIILT